MAPKHFARVAALAAALALAALPAAMAAEQPTWSITELSTGDGAPANCTFDGGLGGNWLEITQAGGRAAACRRHLPPACPLLPPSHRPTRLPPCSACHTCRR